MRILPTEQNIELALGINPNGRLQKKFVHECRRRMDKYTPFDTGALENTAFEGEDYIEYVQDYDYYVYNGERQDGTHKIINYSHDKHPLATDHWDIAMWTAEKDKIVDMLQKELGK